MKSQVKLEIIGFTCDVFVTKVSSEMIQRRLGGWAVLRVLALWHANRVYSVNVPRSVG
jgi:hypothetical protein